MTNESNTNIPTTPAEGNGAAAGPPPAPPGDDGGDLPEILANDQFLPRVSDAAWAALTRGNTERPDCFATALVL